MAESFGSLSAKQGSKATGKSSCCRHSGGPGRVSAPQMVLLLPRRVVLLGRGLPAGPCCPLLAGVRCSSSHQHVKFSSCQPRPDPTSACKQPHPGT